MDQVKGKMMLRYERRVRETEAESTPDPVVASDNEDQEYADV
jgi:hypothetical protein